MAPKTTRFIRDYRRPGRLDMGLPPHKPRRGWRWEWLFPVLVCIVLFGPPLGDALNGVVKETDGCRVLAIVDGDTVKLFCPISGFITGRILAYDTPEFAARCPSELWGAIMATYALRWMLWSGRSISTKLDGVDRYGRGLVVLLVDGRGVARQMVEGGYARWYDGGRRTSWCN